MDNHDLLLNIAVPSHRSNPKTTPQTPNNKKEKYSISFKKERAKNYKRRNAF